MKYKIGGELPDLALTWLDRNGDPVDFSNGWTFEVKLAPLGSSQAVLTKDDNVTGSDTAPNLVIAWALGDLDGLTAGTYEVQIKATASDGRDRYNPEPVRITIEEVIT